MTGASHPSQERGLNPPDDNGNERCAFCGRSHSVHPEPRTAAPGPAAREFRDRFTVFPDTGIVELNCFRCDGTPRGNDTWEVGYHPSLDVLIEQARVHDATRHGVVREPAGRPATASGPGADYEQYIDRLFAPVRAEMDRLRAALDGAQDPIPEPGAATPGQAADFAENDAGKLDALADWFDLYDARPGGTPNGEVQEDLRRMAKIVRHLAAVRES